jgi:hypothetical protein
VVSLEIKMNIFQVKNALNRKHTFIKTPTLFKFFFVHLTFSSKSGEFGNKNEHLSSGKWIEQEMNRTEKWFNEIILSFQIHIWYFNQGNHRVIKKIQTKFTIEPNKLNGLIKNQINHCFLEKKVVQTMFVFQTYSFFHNAVIIWTFWL